MGTTHIEANREDVAKHVLMPGDPRRCQYIAEKYLTSPKLINSLRGETAYTGYYKEKLVTVFPSGMGMPSAGIYAHELFGHYDVDTIIRIGTAGSYVEDLKVGNVLIADSAYSQTNYDEETINKNMNVINSSFELNGLIEKTAAIKRIPTKMGRVHSTDAFYNEKMDKSKYIEEGCMAVEMECFALFLNAKKFFKNASAILTISDELYSDREMDPIMRERGLDEMITLALETIIKL